VRANDDERAAKDCFENKVFYDVEDKIEKTVVLAEISTDFISVVKVKRTKRKTNYDGIILWVLPTSEADEFTVALMRSERDFLLSECEPYAPEDFDCDSMTIPFGNDHSKPNLFSTASSAKQPPDSLFSKLHIFLDSKNPITPCGKYLFRVIEDCIALDSTVAACKLRLMSASEYFAPTLLLQTFSEEFSFHYVCGEEIQNLKGFEKKSAFLSAFIDAFFKFI